MFFVGDATESTHPLEPVWPCGRTAVVRRHAPAFGFESAGYLYAVGGGLVDDVATPGWLRHSSHGGPAGGARDAGGRPAGGQAGTRAARVEQYGSAEPRTQALAADDRVGGLRRDLHEVDGGRAIRGAARPAVPAGRILDAVAAHAGADCGLPAGQQSPRRNPLAGDSHLDGTSPAQWVGRTPLLGADARRIRSERTSARPTDSGTAASRRRVDGGHQLRRVLGGLGCARKSSRRAVPRSGGAGTEDGRWVFAPGQQRAPGGMAAQPG